MVRLFCCSGGILRGYDGFCLKCVFELEQGDIEQAA